MLPTLFKAKWSTAVFDYDQEYAGLLKALVYAGLLKALV
jgi:hypothetical protein